MTGFRSEKFIDSLPENICEQLGVVIGIKRVGCECFPKPVLEAKSDAGIRE